MLDYFIPDETIKNWLTDPSARRVTIADSKGYSILKKAPFDKRMDFIMMSRSKSHTLWDDPLLAQHKSVETVCIHDTETGSIYEAGRDFCLLCGYAREDIDDLVVDTSCSRWVEMPPAVSRRT